MDAAAKIFPAETAPAPFFLRLVMANAGALGPGTVAVAAAEARINDEQAAAVRTPPRGFFFRILFS